MVVVVVMVVVVLVLVVVMIMITITTATFFYGFVADDGSDNYHNCTTTSPRFYKDTSYDRDLRLWCTQQVYCMPLTTKRILLFQ